MTMKAKALFPFALGCIAGALAGLGWSSLSSSCDFRKTHAASQETNRPAASSTAALPAAEGPSKSQRLAELEGELAGLQKKMERLRQENGILRAVSKTYGDPVLDDALAAMREGDASSSQFTSIEETTRALGAANRRMIDLEQRFPEIPPEGTPEHKTFQEALEDAMHEGAAAMLDPRFLSELNSKDPQRVARLKSLIVAETLQLEPDQIEAVQDVLESAYRVGYDRKLDADHKPPDDATLWNEQRRQLNAQTAERIRPLLSPEQRALFDKRGGDSLLFQVGVGLL